MEEVDPADTASLKRLAQSCAIHLQTFSDSEQECHTSQESSDGFWASRQSAEFNMWCAKVGILGEGHRSLDIRLKDVPEIFELLMHLLESLQSDLNGWTPRFFKRLVARRG
jgi:hypothetical protein